jgi:uncharacterized membrane protein (UPF0127 family)
VSDRRGAAGVLLVVVGLVALVGVVVLAVRALASDDDPTDQAATADLTAALAAARPATAPFAGLTATRLSVGGSCLRTVVADDAAERVEGLRQRSDLGPYDAMLFVFPGPTDVGFTMSTVPVALEIGFYSADGTRTSARHMTPCPEAEARCPVYRADHPFTHALETLGDDLPTGDLSSCA